ncbi:MULTISPECIES: hypothetical protein [unclassified Variovorax]|uniref:hypothetical protein n=1 Tax=unclassified Variovorax TaxID=663243 RepID=UPI002577BC89|nr:MULTISPECIES: hypothetical protein [unclassified Variovorax]MDM0091021.1 hypothetical protein [Variovorax sp. J22G40]MDM0148977.1 hypothetical protein [Variovorax sp. J2P1-31]
MEKIILFVDDAAYAREFLAKAPAETVSAGAKHWVLVACAPRMTHRISKWVSHSARENWRGKWFAKVQEQVLPLLRGPGDDVTPVLAQGSLTDLTQRLKLEHGAARVIDARRPKLGVEMEPVTPGQKPVGHPGWALPGATLGLGALLVLANELAE